MRWELIILCLHQEASKDTSHKIKRRTTNGRNICEAHIICKLKLLRHSILYSHYWPSSKTCTKKQCWPKHGEILAHIQCRLDLVPMKKYFYKSHKFKYKASLRLRDSASHKYLYIYSYQHHSWQPKSRYNPHFQKRIVGLVKYSTFKQWIIIQQKQMKCL